MKRDGTDVKEVRVTDPKVVEIIVAEQHAGQDASATHAVRRVMQEYRVMKKFIRPSRRSRKQPA